MKKMKKSRARKIAKALNAIIALMMILQPVGTPSLLGVVFTSHTAQADTVQAPADQPTDTPADSGTNSSDKKDDSSTKKDDSSTDSKDTTSKSDSAPTSSDASNSSVSSDASGSSAPTGTETKDTAPDSSAGTDSGTAAQSQGTDTKSQTPADTTQDNTSAASDTSSSSSGTVSPDAAATDQGTSATTGQVCLDDGAKITDSAKSDWTVNDKGDTAETNNKVELGVKYIFPGDDNVSVTFTCLPSNSDDRTTLKIQQINSSDITLPDGVVAASDYAYDVTTGMKDGDFKYDLTLPKSDVDGAEVKYIEKTAEEATSADVKSSDLKSVDEKNVKEEKDYTKVSKLDHFTIYIVVSPSSASDTTGIGTVPWTGTGNVFASDSSYATATLDSNGEATHYLKVTGFNTNVPAGATIRGIQVEVERKESGSSLRITDNSVKLVKNGTIGGTEKSTGTSWPTSEAYITYGGPNDTWGQAWTPTDINNSTSGFVISAKHDTSSSSRDLSINHIRMTVYTAPTVTINQAAGQLDPTSASTINFTVIFSSSVTGFTSSDVILSGTAGGTKTVTVTGSGTTYNVAVSGMTTSGTVIANIVDSAAQDTATNSSAASTSSDNSVTYNIALSNQTITVTSHAPASAAYGSTFPVAATGGASGNPVVITATGGCSISSGTVTMTSGTDVCTVHYNQAGNGTYNPASEVIETTTASKKSVTVTADNLSKTVGDADPALTYKITSGALVGTDAFTGALSRVAGETVGTYAINQNTLALDTSKYALTYVPGVFTISAVPDPNAFDKGMVTFSFDDGDASAFNNRGELGSYKGTYYVDTMDMIGATEGGGQYYTDYMTASNLQTLYNGGNEIAAHSRTHVDLSTISDPTQLQFETEGSRLDLLSIGVKPVSGFAYPFGTVSAVDSLKSSGFVGARTVDFIDAQGQPLYNTKSSDRYGLYAAQVNGDTPITSSDPHPAQYFGSVEDWIDGAIASNKWLILVFHEIKTDCGSDNYCITPSKLSTIVSYLQSKSSNLNVVTVKDGLAKMDNNPSSDGKAPDITITQADSNNNINAQATSPSGASVAFSPVVTDSDPGLPGTLNAFCTISTEVEVGTSGVSFPTVVNSGYNFPMGVTDVTCSAADTGGNLATKIFTVTVTDAIPPSVTLSTTSVSPTKDSPIPVTATFSKVVTGFDASDVVVGNGSVSNFAGSGATYTFDIAPAADGAVTVDIPAGAAQDSALNLNTAATQLSIISDRTAPVITIVQPDTTPAKSKTITASANEGTLGMSLDAGSVCDGTLAFVPYADTTFSAETDNGKTICYKAEDSATNISYSLSSVIAGIDTTAPDAPTNLGVDTGTPTNLTTQIWSWNPVSDAIDYIYRVTSGTDTVIPETSTGNYTNVQTNLVEGMYNFFVKALDSAGNLGVESFFTLTVDTTPPVIASHADETAQATSNAGAVVSYTSPATSDNYDSAGTATCLPDSGSTFALGDTTVTCNAADSSKNAATPTTFIVHVVDSESPIITLLGDNPQTIQVHSGAYSDPGSTVSDNYDKNLVASVTGSVDSDTVGSYALHYNVTDSNGNNASEVTRTVTVVDSSKPVISLLGDNPMNVEINTAYNDPGATVSDNYDNNLVASVDSSDVNVKEFGSYAVKYDATDSSGNAADEVTRTVNVVDTTAPVIAVTPADNSVEINSSFTDAGATWTDNYDGSGTIDSATSGSVDMSTVGDYTLTYSYTDAHGNTGSANRIVHVVDTIAPSTPDVNVPPGDYMTDQYVSLYSTDDGSGLKNIYYTLDESTPNQTKILYTGAIKVDKDMTIKARAYDNSGNASAILTAVYGIAPVISSEASSSIKSNHTTITWTTDDPATSRVVYGTVSHPTVDDSVPNYGYANSTIESDVSPKVTSHTVVLSGLSDNTTYYYRTISHGSPESAGDEMSFTTDKSSGGGGGGGGGGHHSSHHGSGGSTSNSAGVTTASYSAAGKIVDGVVAGEEQNASDIAGSPAQAAENPGQVLGAEQSSAEASAGSGGFGSHPYIYSLLVLILIGLGYYGFRKYRLKKMESK